MEGEGVTAGSRWGEHLPALGACRPDSKREGCNNKGGTGRNETAVSGSPSSPFEVNTVWVSGPRRATAARQTARVTVLGTGLAHFSIYGPFLPRSHRFRRSPLLSYSERYP